MFDNTTNGDADLWVRSADGTRLSVRRRGTGRRLVLIHGSASDGAAWAALGALLVSTFELWILDRRGHGLSDRGASSDSIEREAEDIRAVMEHAGPDAIMFAHSFGARGALEALIAGVRPAAAILYEPLDSADSHYAQSELERFARLEAEMLDPATTIREYFRVLAAVPEPALSRMEGGPEWLLAEAAIGTLADESRAWYSAPIDMRAVAGIDCPVCLLIGSRSADAYQQTARRLAVAMPTAVVRILDGQGHVAHQRAPAVLRSIVDEVAAAASVTGATTGGGPTSCKLSNIMLKGQTTHDEHVTGPGAFVTSAAQRPIPHETADSRPFWAGTREGRIDIQRCGACGRYRFYPRLLCPECWHDEAEWVTSTGRGEIYSFTIVRRAPSAGFMDALPYPVGLVELDEGVRLVGQLITDDFDAITVGARVQAVFERVDDEITLPHFVLEEASS